MQNFTKTQSLINFPDPQRWFSYGVRLITWKFKKPGTKFLAQNAYKLEAVWISRQPLFDTGYDYDDYYRRGGYYDRQYYDYYYGNYPGYYDEHGYYHADTSRLVCVCPSF